MKIAIIIPFFNGQEFLNDCLHSLSQNKEDFTIYLIDNSTIAQVKLSNILKNYKNVVYYRAKPYIGYGKACNIGANLAINDDCDIIIILNQDSVVDSNFIEEIVRPFAYNEKIVLTAPQIYTYDFETIESFFIKWFLTQCPEYFMDALNGYIGRSYKMDRISGTSFAIKANFVKKYALFDELYFMYMEDDDLCRRVKYMNFNIVLNPHAKVGHLHSHTMKEEHLELKITGWKRKSFLVYTLKEQDKPVLFNLFKIVKNSITDLFNALIHFKIKKFIWILLNDVIAIPLIFKALNSRKVERKFILNEGVST